MGRRRARRSKQGNGSAASEAANDDAEPRPKRARGDPGHALPWRKVEVRKEGAADFAGLVAVEALDGALYDEVVLGRNEADEEEKSGGVDKEEEEAEEDEEEEEDDEAEVAEEAEEAEGAEEVEEAEEEEEEDDEDELEDEEEAEEAEEADEKRKDEADDEAVSSERAADEAQQDVDDGEELLVASRGEPPSAHTRKQLKGTALAAGEAADAEPVSFGLPEWEALSLHPLILRGIQKLGFARPTPIQARCIPAGLLWKDVVGAAETGSGKTLAFGIPILQRIILAREESAARGGGLPQQLAALILVPTRELGLQVAAHIRAAGEFTSVGVATLVGGMAPQKQERLLGYRPAIVVATPGRLWDMIQRGQPHVSDMSGLLALVLDEADRMVAGGHYKELTDILDYVQRRSARETADVDALPYVASDVAPEPLAEKPSRKPAADAREKLTQLDVAKASRARTRVVEIKRQARRQVFLFSATLTLPDAGRWRGRDGKAKGRKKETVLDKLVSRIEFRGRPFLVDLSSKASVEAAAAATAAAGAVSDSVPASAPAPAPSALSQTLVERRIECLDEEKDVYLYYFFLKYPGRTLVFCNTIACLRRLVGLFTTMRVAVWGIHANMQQRQRLKNLDRFRSNPRALLISSDVLARGLDVKGVDQVVHYQLPPTAETYVHRSGRTARAGAQGLSVALVGEHERETFRQLCRVLGKTGGMPSLPVDAELLPALRRRLQAARVVDRLTHRQRKLAADHNWMRRHADAMGIELEEELPRPHGRPAKRGRAGGARGALDEDDDGSGRPSISKAERRELARAQAALDALLAEPVLPRRVARSFFTLNSQLPDMSAEQVDFSSVRR